MKKVILLLGALVTMGSQVAMAQSRTIKGKVVDKNGEGVTASVFVKGTTKGTTTDIDGNYEIEVPDGNNFLVIESLTEGKKEIEIKDASQAINVEFTDRDAQELQVTEVYGTKLDKRSFTGSLNTVGAADIARRPVTDLIKALDGSAPGVNISSGGGQPGQTPDILIRGVGSLGANNSPLIVLDGAPYSGTLVSINPSDVESTTFLKDATATALYGSRGANGVILVTTKRGSKTGGKPRINIDASTGILNRFLPEYERLGVKDYYEKAYDAWVLSPGASGASADFVTYLGNYNSYNVPNDQLMIDGKVNPNASLIYTDDWQEDMQRTGIRQNYNLSVSNGDGRSDYFFSLGYTKDQGIVKNSDYDRFTTRLNLNTQVASWLKAGVSLAGTLDDQRFFLSSNTAFTNPFFTTRMMAPIYPVYRYDANGQRMFEPDGVTPIYDFGKNDANNPSGLPQERQFALNTNVIASLFQDDRTTKSLNGFGRAYLEATFLKDFTLNTNFVLNYYNGTQDNFQNSRYGDASNVMGRMNRGLTTQYSYTFNQMLKWKPSFSIFGADNLDLLGRKKHNLEVSLIHEAYSLRNQSASLTRTGFTGPDFKEGAGAAVGTGSSTSLDYQTIESYLALLSYDYRNKYYLTANIRRDGTSRFSPTSRWGTFGSVGLGWIVSDEPFMDFSKSWLSLFKVRGSYGVTGQQDLGAGYYVWRSRYNFNHNNLNPGVEFATWGNADLKWEGRLQANVGFDAEFFNSRLRVGFDYFNNGSRDMLYGQPLASSTGVGSIPTNIGDMLNKGVELSINADIVKSKGTGFNWNTRLNLTHLKNRLTKSQTGDTIITGARIIGEGYPVNAWYMVEYAGVDPESGVALYYRGDRTTTDDYASLTSADYKYFGSPFRDLDGSWTNNFTYKNFDLSFMISFGLGGKFYDATYQNLMATGSDARGQAWHVDMLNAWTPENKETDVPRASFDDRYGSSTSSRFLISNSFASLKNVNIGYTFTGKSMTKLGFSNLRVYVAADNVFYMAARKGVDLGQELFGNSSFTYYPYRTITFGVNIGL